MDRYIAEQFEKLHGMPEVGYTETRTSAYLADCLEDLGYQVRRNIGTTGVIGVMDSGAEGPAFALRADMDALPFTVDGQETAIHACGHDAKSIGLLRTVAGEDIYYFNRLCGIKIGYIGIGADMKHGLHQPEMCFDHHAMEIGADILEQVIDLRLGLGPKS